MVEEKEVKKMSAESTENMAVVVISRRLIRAV